MGDRRQATTSGARAGPGFGFGFVLPWIAIAALLSAGAALAPSPTWAILALLAFAGFAFALSRHAPTAAVLLAPLLILRLTEFASGAAIENGATMVETGTVGGPTGAFPRLLLFELLLLVAGAWPIERAWRQVRDRFATTGAGRGDRSRSLLLLLVGLFGLASIFLAILAASHGLPLLGPVDRFTYLERLDGTPYRSIMMNRPVVAPLIGILIAARRTRAVGLALLAWLLGGSVLFGEKFTSLLLIVGGAAAPLLLARLAATGRLPLRPLLAAAGLLAAVSLPAIFISYGGADDAKRAWSRLADRAAVQGQLWYLADREPRAASIDFPALRADLVSWASPSAQHAELAGTRFGLYYAMARFTPSHRLKLAQRGGNGFVFALYPFLILAGGVAGLVIGGLAVALAQGWALALLMRALAEGRWLAALAFARLVNASYACLTTGYLWNMFGIKSIATLLLGLVLLRLPPIGQLRVTKNPVNGRLQSA
ncbi:MAG: DUF6418 domain-containing protein [Sphingomicrobium sp.]